MALGKYEESPTLSQNFTNFLIHKRLKIGPEFLVYPSSLFRFVSVHRTPRWNGIGFDCSSDLKHQKMLSWKWYRTGRP